MNIILIVPYLSCGIIYNVSYLLGLSLYIVRLYILSAANPSIYDFVTLMILVLVLSFLSMASDCDWYMGTSSSSSSVVTLLNSS